MSLHVFTRIVIVLCWTLAVRAEDLNIGKMVQPVPLDAKVTDPELLKVTPESRAKDIVNWLGKSPAYEPLPLPARPLRQGKSAAASSTFDQPGYDAANACDGDIRTRWASDFAARDGWLAVDLGEGKEIGSVWLSEIEWPETLEFTIEIKQGDAWKEIARGTTIGADETLEFPPVRAREVRLHVLKAKRPININEFQLFAPDKARAMP